MTEPTSDAAPALDPDVDPAINPGIDPGSESAVVSSTGSDGAEVADADRTTLFDVPQEDEQHGRPRFTVRLTNFEGPFDLLLQLISKHKLDVTEVSLSKVTDDFIAHIRAMGAEWDLAQATEFLLVAATLLDLKAARLLPAGDVDDEDDLALLEARDLLFARLLQYRAYKQVAAMVAELIATAGRRYPRAVSLEPRYAEALPELLIGVGVDRFAAIALRALTPKEPESVRIDHLHAPQVSVKDQMDIMRERLRSNRTMTFRSLTADCQHTLEVVARFLGLLELYRDKVVTFEQMTPLGELSVRWTAGESSGDDLITHNPDEDYE